MTPPLTKGSPVALPSWAAAYAGLNDAALIELANPGLVRRARRLVERVVLISADEAEVMVTCDDLQLRLLPSGPTTTRCPCPVAGVCVHVVTAWLWARAAGDWTPAEIAAATSREETVAVVSKRADRDKPERQARRADAEAAAVQVRAVIEGIVATGVSQAVQADADRLSRAGQGARLAGLPRTARLVAIAAGQLKLLLERQDDMAASAVSSALAQAWACAAADATSQTEAQETGTDERPPGRLIPLAVKWWQAPAGARGLTYYGWDADAGRIEQATNGRSANADLGFTANWEAPLLWGASPARLCSGPFKLRNPRRREDGTLAPASVTTVEAIEGWADVPLEELAAQVNTHAGGKARVAFGATEEPLRIVLPRRSFGFGVLELDEVAQQIILPLNDRQGDHHRLMLPATEANMRLLTWLLKESKALAIVRIGERPEAAFLPDRNGMRLVSLSLTPLPLKQISPTWISRLMKLDQHRQVATSGRELTELERLCGQVKDVVDALCSSGQAVLGSRHRETLTRCQRELDNLGLGTLSSATTALLTQASPSHLLWARFILDRLAVLLTS